VLITELDCHSAKPLFGLIFHCVGASAAASFYVPASVVMGSALDRRGAFSWIAAAWLFGSFGTQGLAQTRPSVLHSESVRKSTMSERSTDAK
jgi:hypothetical protein